MFYRDIQHKGKNEALSGTLCNIKFSFCFISKFKAIWKENLVGNQKTLRAFITHPLKSPL